MPMPPARAAALAVFNLNRSSKKSKPHQKSQQQVCQIKNTYKLCRISTMCREKLHKIADAFSAFFAQTLGSQEVESTDEKRRKEKDSRRLWSV